MLELAVHSEDKSGQNDFCSLNKPVASLSLLLTTVSYTQVYVWVYCLLEGEDAVCAHCYVFKGITHAMWGSDNIVTIWLINCDGFLEYEASLMYVDTELDLYL